MDNETTFLPRLENDTQTGPILFTTDGNQNSNIVFEKADFPLGLTNSLLIQNAGRETLNGTYNYVAINDEKPFYTKGTEGYYFVIWINNRWEIYDFSLDSDPIYYSDQNTNYPWQVTSWIIDNPEHNPAPIITIL